MARNDDDSQRRRPDLQAPGGGLSLHSDRLIFLEKVAELVPECLQDLQLRALSDEEEGDVLEGWCDDWNLADDWLREVAEKTYRIYSRPATHRQRRETWRDIYRWNRPLQEEGKISSDLMRRRPPPEDDGSPPYRELRFYALGHTQPDLTPQATRDNPFFRRPGPSLPHWPPDPEHDSKADAQAAFERYWEALRERSLQEGGSEAAGKRRRSSDDPDLHFAWLARWQVGGESQQEIADNPGEDVTTKARQTVHEGIADAASRIGLTRRSQL